MTAKGAPPFSRLFLPVRGGCNELKWTTDGLLLTTTCLMHVLHMQPDYMYYMYSKASA